MGTGSMVFVFNGKDNWKISDPNDWDLESMDLDGSEKVLGHKKLDGAICKVVMTSDKKIAAISK